MILSDCWEEVSVSELRPAQGAAEKSSEPGESLKYG